LRRSILAKALRDLHLWAAGAGRRFCASLVLAAGLAVLWTPLALALEPIVVEQDLDRIDVTALGELYEGRGDRLQIETAAGDDGITGRMAVQAATPGTNPNWIVFALKNPTDERVVRWLTAARYSHVGSQIFWPNLDTARIAAVTPSLGFRPERIDNDRADIFQLTLEPGATVTFVAELSSLKLPQLMLWNAQAYERTLQDRMLFNGIMLGIVGLLAIFLTSIVAANHKAIFPATALVAWSALALFCVDFGFWGKLFQVGTEETAMYRASTEAVLAASLVLFLYTFLRINYWHTFIKIAFGLWILGQLALVGLAVLDPRLASGLARASFAFTALGIAPLIVFLAVRGQERALSLIPTWILFLVWTFGAAMVVSGQLSGEIVVSGMVAGLVLLIVLLGFTVTQYAFRSGEPIYGALSHRLQLHSHALEGSGANVWDWNMKRDEITVSPDLEDALGLAEGALNLSSKEWLVHVHPSDRERLRLLLWSLQEHKGGELNTEMRLRRSDSSYLWYELRAQCVEYKQPPTLRCVGLMRDVTGSKRTHERLLHDAVHDSLTGLPNRELFLDRLGCAVTRTRQGDGNRPTVLHIDIDRFKNVNRALGLTVGDTMLLTVARRLARQFRAQDTLARIGGDQFAALIVSETDPHQIATMAEQVCRSLRTPMKIADKEVILTGSVGIAIYDGQQTQPEDLLKEAEIAMLRAKRSGTDRIDIFKADMRNETDDRLPLESDLRRALEREQIVVLFQPIMRLSDESVAGFEALMRWDHPKHGRLNPDDFIPIAEESGLMGALGAYVVQKAVENASQWHSVYSSEYGPLFVSINISNRQLFKQDMIQQIRLVLSSDLVPKGTLWLEFTESLVMENPEQAIENMTMLKNLGAHLSLDDFGTGYSSLSYLQRFPIDAIKVDRSFVRQSELNGSSPVILKSVIALSHELDKVVVAEGIETEKDAAYLRLIGCEYGQGFFYGEPQEQTKVVRLLKALAKIERKTKPTKPQPAVPEPERTLAMLKSPVPTPRQSPPAARPQPRAKPAPAAAKPAAPKPVTTPS